MKTKNSTKWTMGDVMRLSHPKGVDPAVGNFILRGEIGEDSPAILHGFKAVQAATSAKDVVAVLNEHKNLPWETIPTQFLKDVDVWKTLFHNNALKGQALVRNVTRLARIGAFKDVGFAAEYAARLSDEKNIERGRLHPLNYLNALVVHNEGQVGRNGYSWYGGRNKDWTTSPVIADALEDGFYKAFKYVEPANKRTLVGIDISGSMGSLASSLDLTCAQVAAAMAMTIVRTEPAYAVIGFNHSPVEIPITARQNLNTVMRSTPGWTGGGTDVAKAIEWASHNNMPFDTIVTITDNDTYMGTQKVYQALEKYRDKFGIPTRSIVVGLNSNGFTVADPRDNLSLDVVGGDANLPALITNFSAGRI